MPNPGEIIANTYQIVDEIGKGGAGIIYRAFHLNLQKYVVVKKIIDHYVGVLNARGEVDILKSLHHTCLPQVYDFVQIGNDIYTVMDYIEGHDLKFYIDNGYQFEESTLWMWMEQLLDVLNYLHEHGILHLDIKPANIMLTQEGNVVLIDFNISLSGNNESLSGISKIFASPEQYAKWEGVLFGTENQSIVLDPRTDIYSLGASFYQLMTRYYPSPNTSEMIPITEFQLPYSEALVRIIGRMMEHDRNQRYDSARLVIQALRRLQRSKAERYTLRAVFGLMTTAIVVLVVVFGIVLYRNSYGQNKAEQLLIQKKEEVIAGLIQKGEYESAYLEGAQFLKDNSKEIREEEVRQGILELMINAAMGVEDYDAVLECAEDLLRIEEKPEYYQNAAVACAYLKEYQKAENYIEMARSAGGAEELLKESKAEIFAAQGKYDSAIKIYENLYLKNNEQSLLRKLAALYVKVGFQENQKETEVSKYLGKAMEYYEILKKDKSATYADLMNLSVVYDRCGMGDKALSLLESMRIDYPEQYRIYLRCAELRYEIQMKLPEHKRDFSIVLQEAEKARELYEAGNYKEKDEALERLMDIVHSIPQ